MKTRELPFQDLGPFLRSQELGNPTRSGSFPRGRRWTDQRFSGVQGGHGRQRIRGVGDTGPSRRKTRGPEVGSPLSCRWRCPSLLPDLLSLEGSSVRQGFLENTLIVFDLVNVS